MRTVRVVAFIVASVVATGGRTLTQFALRYAQGGSTEPFWCAPTGGTALNTSDCTTLSSQLDQATAFAYAHDHASAAIAA